MAAPPRSQTWPQVGISKLDTVPTDGSFNLYVRGLSRDTTVASLLNMFEPYGQVLSCKPMLDIKSGYCRGDGFVRYDSEDGYRNARRELTQRGLYISAAHETATMKHLVGLEKPQLQHQHRHIQESAPTITPEIGDSQEFPSLPPRKKESTKEHVPRIKPPLVQTGMPKAETQVKPDTPPETPTTSSSTSIQTPVDGSRVSCPLQSSMTLETPNTTALQTMASDTASVLLSPTCFESSSDFAGLNNQGVSNMSPHQGLFGGYQNSFFSSKGAPSIDDVDNYMSTMLHYGLSARRSSSQDLFPESYRQSQAVLFFKNLPDGETYLDLFERCSYYGSLVLTSVDIRYINEDCHGQGKVTFTTAADSEIALRSFKDAGYNVTRELSEPSIDMDLFDQLHRQHPDALDAAFDTHTHREPSLVDHWGFEFAGQFGVMGSTPCPGHSLRDSPTGHEKQSMFGMSPLPASLSPGSSSTVSLPNSHDWSDISGTQHDSPSRQLVKPVQDDNIPAKDVTDEMVGSSEMPSKPISYSEMVKVPPKPVPKPVPTPAQIQFPSAVAEDFDMKRRGNTNKSLEKNEYRLNLYLKNLESTMDDCQLYDLCVKY
ncbi:hypothetical protein BG004_006941, partial [Podila humilis]